MVTWPWTNIFHCSISLICQEASSRRIWTNFAAVYLAFVINCDSVELYSLFLVVAIKTRSLGREPKTKVMWSGERQKSVQKAARSWPCGVCGRGVGSNSIQCTSCQKWIHKKFSGKKRLNDCTKWRTFEYSQPTVEAGSESEITLIGKQWARTFTQASG